MVQRRTTHRKRTKAVLVLLTVSVAGWLVAAYLTSKAAPVKLPKWHLRSGSVTDSLKYPILCLLYAVGDNIRAAVPIVTEERERIRAERDAFDDFIERVQALDPDQQHLASHPQQMPVLSSSNTDHLQQVREAYEDTVMAVPHYEEDYGDTVDESLVEEFGEEIAIAMESSQQFSPPLKRHFLQAANVARERRTNFLSILNQEEKALESARTTLTELEDQLHRQLEQPLADVSIDELLTRYDRLHEYERQCEAILQDRQHHRTTGHAAVTTPGSSNTDLQTYLYQPLSTTYPVLADGSALLETLQTTQHRVTTELAWR
jgi:uncharacterized membrane protein YhdT/DNA repair exonuclease SbcCD ATPase subunit